MAYLANPGPETALGPLLSFQTVSTREPPATPVRCVDAQGFSLHAEVCCAAHERKQLEPLCRYITRPAIATERLILNRAGDVAATQELLPRRDHRRSLYSASPRLSRAQDSISSAPMACSHPTTQHTITRPYTSDGWVCRGVICGPKTGCNGPEARVLCGSQSLHR
jgi:hypothetical protein